jgi:Icc-related predicted phosphoesterase
MKLQILSDLHLEFQPFNPPLTAADVIILAGDIHIGKKGIDWMRSTCPDTPIIYVLGNHECYGKAYPNHLSNLQQLVANTNIQILENERITIDEITFLGCTLWTDFELFDNPQVAGYRAMQTINDYRKIRVSPQYRKLRSIDTAVIHHRSLSWLQTEVTNLKNNREKFVIVTHHAPSKRSIPAEFEGDLLSAAYASHLDRFVADSGAMLWVHGHVHTQQDYLIGNTRVICNPRGYPDEPNENFVPDLTIEL